MARTPIVSVIVTTYNRADLLKETIDSIINQTYQNIELIIVSDASIDHTDEVVSTYQDPRINYIKLQKNTGLPAKTRNKGLTKAKGDYIAFCDDDDLWIPEKLEKQLKMIGSYDLCLTNRAYINLNKQVVPHRPLLIPRNLSLLSLLYTNFVTLSSVLIKKDTFTKHGIFNENPIFKASEDYELWARMLARGASFCACREELVLYRLHQSNISNNLYQGIKRTMLVNESLFNTYSISLFAKITSRLLNYLKLGYYLLKQ